MAIKIISKGTMPEEVVYRIKCGNCKTVFTYQQEDIDVDRDGHYVKCPHCSKLMDVRCGKRYYGESSTGWFNA